MLFIFDFDGTIAGGHVHNAIASQINMQRSLGVKGDSQVSGNLQAQWDIAKTISPSAPAAQWKAMLLKIKEAGHDIAIASFNHYGHVIPRYLQEVIGLDEKLVAEIFIVAEFPKDEQARKNKNAMIDKIRQHFPADQTNRDVVLIDDTPANCEAAFDLGCSTVLATEDGYHLSLLEEEVLPVLTSPDEMEKMLPFFWRKSFHLEFDRESPIKLYFMKELPEDTALFSSKNCYVLTAESEIYFYDQQGVCAQYDLNKAQLKSFIETFNLAGITEQQDDEAQPLDLFAHANDELAHAFNKVLLDYSFNQDGDDKDDFSSDESGRDDFRPF